MKKVVVAIFVLIVIAAVAFVSLKPFFANKSYEKGNILADSAQYDLAIDKYTRAIWFKSKIAPYYFARGKAYAAINNDPVAIEDFSQAIVLNPGESDYYLFRGISQRKLRALDQAMEDLNKAIELNDSSAKAFYHRGLLYASLNQYEIGRASCRERV